MRYAVPSLLLAVSMCSAAGTTHDRVRTAAARGLALVQSSQKIWFAKQSCTSCHHQLLPVQAVNAAREHAIPVNEDTARSDMSKAFAFLSDLDRAIQYHYVIDPAGSEGLMLVGAHTAGIAPSLITAIYARHVAVHQQADGHWVTLDNRPPQSYSNVTATAIALRAIEFYSHPSLAADTKARVERAARWLASVQPQSTEERTFQLYGLSWAGADRSLVEKCARALAAHQNSDGGWSALPGRKSDAYSTGQSLTVLNEVGSVPISDNAWQRGIEYLLNTQAADGSWHVASRLYPPAVVSPPYFDTGYPYGHDQFISSMGASWAVRALAAALGPAHKIDVPVIREAAPKPIEPWVETVLFGSAAQLKTALDNGLNPNASTSSGGTTVLMLVQPDVEKTKLLLDRGASVNVRSKSKYSALLVASLYPQGSPAVRLLLDHGAEVRLPKGSGAPLFNASPVVLATFAGNADIIPRLHQAGAPLDQRMVLLGMFPSSATATAISFGDIATTRALLDAGADPNEADDDGFTLLYAAVIANRTDVARLLIERGAKVNAVDKRGMTPLLYAVSADYGDPSMVDLLVKSGANQMARNPEGLSAIDLSRKYGHSYMFASLSRRTE